jgi:hypothetical protein
MLVAELCAGWKKNLFIYLYILSSPRHSAYLQNLLGALAYSFIYSRDTQLFLPNFSGCIKLANSDGLCSRSPEFISLLGDLSLIVQFFQTN